MGVNYGACWMMRFKAYAQLGEKVFVKSGNCHIEHTAIFCLCYAVVFLYLTSYAYVHLTLYKDDSEVVKFISDYCIKYGRSNSCIGKNVMFCMQRYKCSAVSYTHLTLPTIYSV